MGFKIHEENQAAGPDQFINLVGIVLGNPLNDPINVRMLNKRVCVCFKIFCFRHWIHIVNCIMGLVLSTIKNHST